MSEEKKILSQHLFLFPFVIKPTDKSRSFCREEIRKILKQDGWNRETFKPESNFSEFVYFHKYVRESAFNGKEHEDSFSDFYRKCACPAHDTLKLYWSENDFYKLSVEFVSLHIFETGIGILTIELLNHDYPNLDDVLKINDLARRIYPPYLTDDDQDKPPKGDSIPYKVVISLDGATVAESFEGLFVKEGKLLIAAHICSLLGESFLQQYMADPVIDDRMYTLCWYGNDELSKRMESRYNQSYAYEDSDDWYRFVFVDSGDSCCKNIDMRRELIRKATYARWIEKGTLFGISRYSFVALTDRSDFSYGVVRNHMQRQYFQMAIFLLAQRASTISFASRIARISQKIDPFDDDTSIEKIAGDVRKLQRDFIGFVNRLWFEEVTPQEQGIELFQIAQHQMKLKEQIAELKEEMKELFEYVELQYENKQIENDRKLNRNIGILTYVSAFFLPLTLLTGFWGMNVLEAKDGKYLFTLVLSFWWSTGMAIVSIILIFGLIWWRSKRRFYEVAPFK